MTRASLWVMSALVACTGCAVAERAYEEPSAGPVAEVVFSNDAPGESWLWLYRDAARCSGRRHAGTIPSSGTKELRVRAKRELALTFGYAGIDTLRRGYTCQLTASFVPEAQKTYVVKLHANRLRTYCYLYVGVKDPLVVGGDTPIAANKRVFKKVVWDEDSDFCQPGGAAITTLPDGTVGSAAKVPPPESGPVQLDDLKGLMQK